jgi:hypothetical protein
VFDRKKVEDNPSAGAWLREHLADGKWHDTEEVFERAATRGHTVNAIKQAKNRNQQIKHEFRGGDGQLRAVQFSLHEV